jgi:hypothetical protein
LIITTEIKEKKEDQTQKKRATNKKMMMKSKKQRNCSWCEREGGEAGCAGTGAGTERAIRLIDSPD